MRKITLDIEDSHFAAFEEMARMKNVDPLEMINTQLKQTARLLEAGQTDDRRVGAIVCGQNI
jgi:hypothetical protein